MMRDQLANKRCVRRTLTLKQVEEQLIISKKIKAGFSEPVVADHRTEEEKAQALENYEKAVNGQKPWSKSKRAAAIKNRKK